MVRYTWGRSCSWVPIRLRALEAGARAAGRVPDWIGVLALALLQVPASAAAQDPDQDGITRPSIATSLPANGDPAGIRKWLAGHGVAYQLIYTNDVLSNLRGGLRRGTIDQGKLEAILGADLEKAAGLQGLSFFANVFAIHNTGFIRRDYVGGINTIAEIEAVADDPTVGTLARAEARERQRQSPRRPACSRRRVLLQRRSARGFFCRAIGQPSRRSTCRVAGQPIRCRPPACD